MTGCNAIRLPTAQRAVLLFHYTNTSFGEAIARRGTGLGPGVLLFDDVMRLPASWTCTFAADSRAIPPAAICAPCECVAPGQCSFKCVSSLGWHTEQLLAVHGPFDCCARPGRGPCHYDRVTRSRRLSSDTMVCSITYPWMLCTCGSLCTRGVLLAATFGPGPLGMLVLNVDEVPVVGQFQAMDDGTACSAVCPAFPGAGSNSA